MGNMSNMASAALETSLNFLKADSRYEVEKPYYISQMHALPDSSKTNLEFEIQKGIRIIDVRAKKDEFRLFRNGFRWLNHRSSFNVLDGRQSTAESYLRETAAFLREELNAEQIICYDFCVLLLNLGKGHS